MMWAALIAVLLASAQIAHGHTAHGGVHRASRLVETRRLRGESIVELLRLYPYYHSTADISQRLQTLAKDCPVLSLDKVNDTSQDGNAVALDVVTIRDPAARPVNRNFLVFGEHARELISPESGLHLVESLCGGHGLGSRARQVLKRSEFQMVINANPGSREKVEEGDDCLRVNPNGVDLNRNWDEKWSKDQSSLPDTNPGPTPFSEGETRILRRIVKEYNPTNFVTVHSGTKGLYMPWAYDREHLASRNKDKMMRILRQLDRDYCQCPYGAAGREVGYSCPGTCLDWVFDKLKAPYSFAFEIYTDEETGASLHQRWKEKMQDPDGSFLQENSSLAHEHFRDVFENHPSSFVQLRQESSAKSFGSCFNRMNPGTEAEYKETLTKWTNAFLDLANMVADDLSA